MQQRAFHKDNLGLGMVQDIIKIGLTHSGIYRNQDGAYLLHREVDHVPLRTVVGDHRYTVTFADTQPDQALADGVSHLYEVAADIFLPCPVHLAGEHDFLLAKFLNESRQKVEST